MTKNIKISNTPSLIVSVESRKGGVGKTTAALCMSRLLKKDGFTVLFLDLDVTGTNAADIASSPFWEKDLHVVQETRKGNDDSKVESSPVNFLALFDHCFMTGKPIPLFSVAAGSPGELSVDPDRVNVLGSQIYRMEDPKKEKNNGKSNGLTCLERPNVLFDDLHTLWLLDFIRQLISDFCRVMHDCHNGRVAVILDNSPGYIGIAPAIHDWLTDRGPTVGKFLTVASLDAQDIKACNQAVKSLHRTYQTKWETGRLFLEARTPGPALSVAKEQEAFFMRLATSDYGIGIPDPLMFFKNEKSSTEAQEGKDFFDARWKYIGLVINRVPRAVKKGRLMYKFSDVSDLAFSLGEQTPSNTENRWREHMVAYDEYIENQFLLQSLQRGIRKSGRQLQHLIKYLDLAENRIYASIEVDGPNNVMLLFENAGGGNERLRSQLINANEAVTRARSFLDDAGFGHLARLIHDEWLPGNIVPAFRRTLSGLLRESDFPYLETMPFDWDTDPVNPEAHDFVTELKKRIMKEARDFEPLDIDKDTINVLASVLASLTGLSLTSPMRHPRVEEEFMGLFAMVLSIELRHWKQRGKGRTRHSIQQFLAEESITPKDIEKEIMMSRSRLFMHHMMRGEGEASFSDFYAACTSAQARLIDFAADSRFLLELMRFMVREETEQRGLFPFVRGLAEDVIERKIIRHEDAPSKMAKALQSAEYFREFDQVLVKILRKWGVSNA